MTKSQVIQKLKKECELKNKITFTTFTEKDSQYFKTESAVFDNLEPEFRNGVKVIFTHKISDKEKFRFMTIIFCPSFSIHFEQSIKDSLREIVGKKLRIYGDIFEEYYFDFEDQCFPTKKFKIQK